jgi:hypothetical protein
MTNTKLVPFAVQVTTGASVKVLDRNPNRVGILWSVVTVGGWVNQNAPAAVNAGVRLAGSASQPVLEMSEDDYGTAIQGEFQAITQGGSATVHGWEIVRR